MGCPGGHEHIPVYSLRFNARLAGHFFLKFSWNKIAMGKKIVEIVGQCLDEIMIAFPPRNIQ